MKKRWQEPQLETLAVNMTMSGLSLFGKKDKDNSGDSSDSGDSGNSGTPGFDS